MITSTNSRFLRGATLTVLALFASVALAQTAPSAGMGTTGPTTTTVVTDGTGGTVVNGVSRVAPGATSTALSTIQLTSTQNRPVQVSGIPLTFTFSGGGSPSNLSNCQLVNSSGTVLNTGSNTLSNIVSGSNTVMLDSPFVIGAGSTQNLTLRCNVSSSAPSGSTFQIASNPSAAVFSLPSALAVTSTAIPVVQNNTVTLNNVPLGLMQLSAAQSGSDVRISSVPVSISTLGSATAASVSSCQLYDPSGVALNTGGNVTGSLTAGSNAITLNTPLTVSAGGATTLTIRCTVLPGTGGTLVLLPGAGSFLAATPAGASVTPTITTVATSPVSLGTPAAPIDPTIPGVPSTGLGDKTNQIVGALLAAVLLLGGIAYYRSRRMNA